MRQFTIIDCEQKSAEWFAARAGRVGGSVAADVIATLKGGGEPACRRDLRTRLALERLTGQSLEDDYENADMRRGRELEPDARAEYEAVSGVVVEQTGYLAHTELLIGASLDGHLGDFDGIVELKAPRPANHLRYLRTGGLPPEHRAQIAHNLLVTDARFAVFVSFCPVFPPTLRLFQVRVERQDADIAAYELLLRQFLNEVQREYEEVARLGLTTV